MSEGPHNPVLQENIERLLSSSVTGASPDFQSDLTKAVLAEVSTAQGKPESARPRRKKWLLAAAVAASVALALLAFWPTSKRQVVSHVAGSVKPVRGWVSVANGGSPRAILNDETIRAGQWIRTYAGSEARIELEDRSRLHLRPRSRIQLKAETHGPSVVLQEGRISVEAAKQPTGSHLTIETAGSQIKVLGTKLDVDLIVRPDGSKRTRVSVASGTVELASGGKTLRLGPNMEGIADEGQPPIARSLTAEVNEMVRLIDETEAMAAKGKVPPGPPAIIDFNDDASATVWTLVSIENPTDAELNQYELKCALGDPQIRAFTLEGASLRLCIKDGRRLIDLSCAPVPPGGRAELIARVSGVTGLFEAGRQGVFEFKRKRASSPSLSLFQFRLPHSAFVERAEPRPIETRATLSRLVVTIAGDSPLPDLVE